MHILSVNLKVDSKVKSILSDHFTEALGCIYILDDKLEMFKSEIYQK